MPLLRHCHHKVVPPLRRRVQISSSSKSSLFYGCLFYLIVLTICLPSFIDYHPGVQAAVVLGSGKTKSITTTSNVKTDTEQSKGEFYLRKKKKTFIKFL